MRKESKMNYEKMKKSVGLFLVVVFITLIGFGYVFLDKKGAFNKNYKYYTNSKSAMTFQVGMPVKYSGFDIGSIHKIFLEDDGNVKIAISIDENYQKFMAKNSTLILKKPLLGSPHIELHRASGSNILEENSFLELTISDDINDIVSKLEPVSDKLITIVENMERITSYIASDDAPLTNTLKNLETFSGKLANNDSLLTTITGDDQVSKTLVAALDSLDQTLKNVEKLSEGLEEKIVDPSSQSVKNINDILEDIKQKLKKLDQTVDTVVELNPDIKNIKKEIEYATAKSNELLDKVDGLLADDKQKMELP
jgi:ABC-type transporter Mla subunit MlaD